VFSPPPPPKKPTSYLKPIKRDGGSVIALNQESFGVEVFLVKHLKSTFSFVIDAEVK
jgi:hypothetical protein